jgi:uncharacterized membrane protein
VKFRANDWVAVTVTGASALLTGLVYADLPERIPTHFNVHGVPDGWASKAFGAWLLPAISALTLVLLRVGTLAFPAGWKGRLAASPAAAVSALLAIFFVALQGVVLDCAVRRPTNVAAPLGLVLGVFWIALGLYMPKIRRNPWVGVRTAWTLSSDENWARTHRVAGYAFVLGGLSGLVLVVAGAPVAAPILIGASAMIPAVYSFVLARRLERPS